MGDVTYIEEQGVLGGVMLRSNNTRRAAGRKRLTSEQV